jgi:hypothetical protein
MKSPIMKSSISNEEVLRLVREIYSSFWSPQFIFRKAKEGITSWDKFAYFSRLAAKYFSKRTDFGKKWSRTN